MQNLTKIKNVLIPCNKGYSNKDISFVFIAQINLKAFEPYLGKTTYTAIKYASVQARKAELGEIIETKPLVRYDNKIYSFEEVKCSITKEMAQNRAMVITDPDGEQYVISTEEKFLKKYKKVGNMYQPISGELQFAKTTKNICFNKNDEIVYVPKGCYICLQDLTRSITNVAFENTYRVINKTNFKQ